MNEMVDTGVLAVVLTFNAPDGAIACVTAIQRQSHPAAAILVVDNHSAAPIERESLAQLGPVPVEILRLDANVGPAGGFAAGLEVFLHGDHRHAWVMDDDVQPDADCLEHLLGEMRAHNDRALVGPLEFDISTGEYWEGWGWWGPLIPRAAVEEAGLPDPQLFWGLEDQEYLRDRLPLAGFTPVRCRAAVTRITTRPVDADHPAWKYYYEERNRTYRYVYDRSHLPRRVQLKSLAAWIRTDLHAIWSSDRGRPTKFAYLFRGIFDGLFHRLGKRVTPDSSDRPWTEPG